MVGERVNDETKHLLDKEIQLGCELGNHTYSHNHYGSQVTASDISKASKQIEKSAAKRRLCSDAPAAVLLLL